MRVDAYSFGCGVQSTAMLLLAAQGELPNAPFLFANVGDDSEHPDTIDYFHRVAQPFAEAHDIEVVELFRQPTKGNFAGRVETLYGRLTREGSRSIPIPMKMDGSGAPGTRLCTTDFKIRVVQKEIKRRGATPTSPFIVAMGISVDEIQRAHPGPDPRNPEQHRVYPLLDLGMARRDCVRLFSDAGMEVPPKSSCWFCPFHTIDQWRDLRNDRPDLFDKACDLEDTLNERRVTLGRDPMWMSGTLRPLRDSVDDQLSLLDGGDCDSGWCMT